MTTFVVNELRQISFFTYEVALNKFSMPGLIYKCLFYRMFFRHLSKLPAPGQ